MKKIFAVLLIGIVTALSLCTLALADDVAPVQVTLNSSAVDCTYYGQEATIVNGRTLVPLRAIFEALGASVEWDQSTKTVTSTLDDITVSLSIGSDKLIKNGEEVALDVPAQIMNNRTVVPVRAVSEAFGVTVLWDKETRTVVLLQDNFKRGEFYYNTYYSEYLSLQFVLPVGFEYLSEGEIRRLMGIGEASLEKEIDYSSFKECYEFVAMDKNGNSVQLMTLKKDSLMTFDEFFDTTMSAYEASGIECSLSEPYDFELGGGMIRVQEAVLDVEGIKLTQTVGVYETDTRFAVGMISSVDDSVKLAIIDGFYDYDEMIPMWKELGCPEVYGNIQFGMTEKELLNVLKGDISSYVNVVTLRDLQGKYDNEDRKITGEANVDFMSFEFEKDALYNIYITTEYTTEEKAKKTAQAAESYYKELLQKAKEESKEGTMDEFHFLLTSDINTTVNSSEIDGKTMYYCAIELRQNQIYLISLNKGDVVRYFPRNEKKVPAELQKTHAYGTFDFGMSLQEVIAAAGRKNDADFPPDILIFYDKENKFPDEDEAITGKASISELAISLNNDLLYAVYITTSQMSLDEADTVIKQLLEYYGKDYRFVEYTNSYIWEKGVRLNVRRNEETGNISLYLVIEDERYLS